MAASAPPSRRWSTTIRGAARAVDEAHRSRRRSVVGHISLPGGGFQTSDGDLLATAIRETHEELGIDLHATKLIGPLPTLSPLSTGPNGIEVTPFAFVDRRTRCRPRRSRGAVVVLVAARARECGHVRRHVHVSRDRSQVPELELRGFHDLGHDLADPRRPDRCWKTLAADAPERGREVLPRQHALAPTLVLEVAAARLQHVVQRELADELASDRSGSSRATA